MPDPALALLAALIGLWLLYGVVRLSRWTGPRRDAREVAAWRATRTDAQHAETWQHDYIH